MIKPRIDQLDRNHKATEHVRDGLVRFDVGAEFVAAEKCVAAEERITFAFEIVILRQPRYLVAVLLHPLGKMRRFTRALLVAKIARNKFFSNRQPGVGGEHHVGQSRLRCHEEDFAIQLRERGV